jgi:hypothetical protein
LGEESVWSLEALQDRLLYLVEEPLPEPTLAVQLERRLVPLSGI